MIVARVENEEKKNEIMRNKSKLRVDRIYIEKDLSWEKRKIQEKIRNWAREQKRKRKEIKIGIGRIKIGGKWRNWIDIEREEKRKAEEGKTKGKRVRR